MNAEHIVYPSEVLELLLWLMSPYLLIAILLQCYMLHRRRVGFITQILTAFIGTVFSLIVCVLIWKNLAPSLLPHSVLPASWPSFPPLFIPGLLAVLFVFGAEILLIKKSNQS